MGQIKVTECPIDGLYVIEPTIHGDHRGSFFEAYNLRDLEEAGIHYTFVQDNENFSTKGVLRGLHFQKQFPQCKLARVTEGVVFDVAVDLRGDSPTYGKWHGEILSAENHRQFLVPEGFAHGLLVLSETATFVYKCTDFYHPGDEGGIAWNDPELGIVWPGLIGEYPGSADASAYMLSDGTRLSLSEKDQKWQGLKDAFRF
jgi:dTDP-4-dehydrorhamnose 3,5-epimerase